MSIHANVPAPRLPPPRHSLNGHVTVASPAADTVRRLDSLPPQPRPLIDRRREAGEIRGLLLRNDVRLLTLTGPGGVGKTRLAVAVAEELRLRFADGSVFVDLAPLNAPRLVLSAIARVLRVHATGGEPPADAVQRALQGREMLLVLDNVEHLLEAVSEVEALLAACPLVKVLATSREPLGLRWEQEFPVTPLLLPREGDLLTPESLADVPAVALFVRLAQAVRPAFALAEENAAAVAEICRRLDGIPLAIELAAARLKALTVEQIAARLDDRFQLLTTGSRTALPRHKTLRGTIDWSHGLLTGEEQALFGRLAVFTGGFTLEAADAVCGLRDQGTGTRERAGAAGAVPSSLFPGPSEDVLDMLAGLVEKSLVQADEQDGVARYRLLETIRQYGLERLEASGEAETVRRRHAEHYLALAEEAEPHLRGTGQAAWLERLRVEHDNLRAALDWLPEHEPELGLRLGAALWRFWDMQGHLSEGRERLAALLQRTETRGRAAARSLHGQGVLARKQGDFDGARLLHEQSLAIHHELGDREGIAHARNSLGMVCHAQGNFPAARAMKEDSLAIMRELGDEWGTAAGLSNLALVLKDMGDVAAALPLEQESLALMRRLGDRRGASHALANLGVTANRLGDFATSRARHEESLALKQELGDQSGIGHSLRNLGQVALSQRDYDAARTWFEEALRLTWQLGDRLMLAACLHGLGAVADARGKPHDAARLYGAAEALRDALGTRLPEPRRIDDDQRIDTARTSLGNDAFPAAWAEGQSMPLDEAVAYALAVAESSTMPGESRASDDGSPLSAREREVATLLAQGLTNRRIAEELVVATSTVDRHVVHILRKLDLASRSQIAAWVVEHRLAAASS